MAGSMGERFGVEQFLREVLDAIERQEARLLVWGLVDGRMSGDELADLIAPLLDAACAQGMDSFYAADEVIAALAERGLLFATDDLPYPGFRSRMAETVRLAFRLRQLFPKHAGPDGWQQAPTLVADFRFAQRRRRYPRRDIDPAALAGEVGADAAISASLAALLDARGLDYRLAAFQVRATRRILHGLTERRTSGTLVSAGTGSGKTLAFYLPAMARVATLRLDRTGGRSWVKLLAIYPRTELLRDQFAEVYAEARRLDPMLGARSAGKVRIGALFAETPTNAKVLLQHGWDGWRRTEAGWVCGFMPCPAPGCEGDLIWSEQDILSHREALACARCGHRVTGEEVVLTRETLQRDPPDVLFTTTEMLNQRMSDARTRHLFGLRPGAVRPPEILLLDEVHSYAGNHGAQVGFLLRRWRHLVRAPITFVGLSATLRDGVRFFARLVGLAEHQVEEIRPYREEMVAEGAEYLLALRGDPVSRTALLSTTIQTAMLMARALDRPDGVPSRGLYGQRVFAFTDDIDVTNRLYFSILDAEGRNDRGEPDLVRHPDGPLAALRRPLPSASRERYGQNWHMAEAIGHPFEERKRVGRTSSQDPGVARGMDLIVATASLEVGFDDPGVGCVIQHKAPRDPAQFLQRKGRAGRPRGMRPWTVVVLSDYGRDRLAYQGYEHLFDPELESRHLPFASRYIQRMQAVYALIDFLGLKLGPDLAGGSVWTLLSGPLDGGQWATGTGRALQTALVKRLAALLDEPDTLAEFSEHLEQALQLSASDVRALLWEYPRPLLTAVIPTALRRLSSNWRRGSEPRADFAIRNNPLPEMATANLFSDLNLPEIQISLPPASQGGNPQLEQMGIEQGLRTFAPGRVSRRFGVRRSWIRHWIAPEDGGRHDVRLEISAFYRADLLGNWLVHDGDGAVEIPVYRPYEMAPVHPPKWVGDTSNAFLDWRSQIVAREPGVPLQVPAGSPWQDLLGEIVCFRHAEHAPLEVRRFALGSHADISVTRGEGYRARFEFLNEGQTAGIGYALSVDGLRILVRLPEALWQRLADSPPLARAVRTERFFDPASMAEALPTVANRFARNWLATIYFAALTHDALLRGVTLEAADAALATGGGTLAVADVLESLFQSSADTDESSQSEAGGIGGDRLRRDLSALLEQADVRAGLRALARCLWEPLDASWEPILRRRFVTTVGAAALEAICDLCPEVDPLGLAVDIDPGPRGPDDLFGGESGEAEVWITETSPGGSGAMEDFLARVSEDPRRFYRLLSAQLRPNEYAQTDFQLRRLLAALAGDHPDPELREAIEGARRADSAAALDRAMSELRRSLAARGYVLYHAFLSALATRVLKPGSTPASDAYLHRLASDWVREEARLGVELDGRSIAFRWSREEDIDRILTGVGMALPQPAERPAWRFNAVYGLLWRRGREIRRIGLEPSNSFCPLPAAERLLVSEYLSGEIEDISVEAPDWRERTFTQLALAGIATLSAPLARRQALAEALRFFAVNPVEVDYLLVYARLAALRRIEDRVEADLEVEEVLL